MEWMNQTLIKKVSPHLTALAVLNAAVVLLFVQSQARAQSPAATRPAATTESIRSATGGKFTEYKGVQLGMPAEEARRRLGKAVDKDKTQDLYVFSDTESAQVFYDDKQVVYAISIDYDGRDSMAPQPAEVLGQDVPRKADGSIYHMEQYPDAGYWVSYNRTAGESPTVTVTIQRISGSKP
jgi:hypothetical protein